MSRLRKRNGKGRNVPPYERQLDEFFEKTHIATKRTVEKAGGKAFSIGRSIFDNEPRYSWYCRDCEMVLIETKNKR